MATPLQNIYNSFLYKVKDYDFIRLNNDGELEGLLRDFLNTAIVKFSNCEKDLSINEEDKSFKEDLSLDEIEILVKMMVFSYVDRRIVDIKNMSLVMSEPDFKLYSQANHLDKLTNLSKKLDRDISELKNIYSLKKGLDRLT